MLGSIIGGIPFNMDLDGDFIGDRGVGEEKF
jgi:hypothetical protein